MPLFEDEDGFTQSGAGLRRSCSAPCRPTAIDWDKAWVISAEDKKRWSVWLLGSQKQESEFQAAVLNPSSVNAALVL